MLTTEQIKEIDLRLNRGDGPEEIAANFGLTYGQLRNALLLSGKRWETYRRLVDTAPAQDADEALVATGERS